jgi:hypothetical protein
MLLGGCPQQRPISRGAIGALGAVPLPMEGPAEPPVLLDRVAPTTTVTVDPAANAAGWHRSPVTITLTAVDDATGTGVRSITYSASGAETTPNTTVDGDSASFAIDAEGITIVTFAADDLAGNTEAAQTLTIRIDTTTPTCACSATPSQIATPDHRLVTVSVSMSTADSGSGVAGFTLVSVTSNEPDNGLGDSVKPNDIQGFVPGTADMKGMLRAERAGAGSGRVYTLTYQVIDVAGNTALCATTVVVPKG